jgi:signal transduction histidine kinase
MTAAPPGRTDQDRIAAEQAALRRVATMVARGASPEQVFTSVAEEAGQLLGADLAGIRRYDPDGTAVAVGGWETASVYPPYRIGSSVRLGGQNVLTLVSETGRSARIDAVATTTGEPAAYAREHGFGCVVGAPITVEGRLWGALLLVSRSAQPLPAGTEARLVGFTELAATAIANAQARTELRAFAEEQAALRRVAVLVARGAPPHEVFTVVTDEAGQLLQVDYTVLSRYDPDGLVTVVGVWARTDPGRPLPIGLRLKPEGRNIHALVLKTGMSARLDDYGVASGAFADTARDWQFRASVGVPIRVEGRLWGVMSAGSRSEPLPADTETRLAGFTELAATALANAEAQAALTASRARVVAAADAARRRIERNLHDGAQQRLVSLALHLREAQAIAPPGSEELAERLERAVGEATGVQEELREISHGLYPAVLTESGLRSALRALARRSAVPVSVDVQLPRRLPEPVETAAYYAVSEALTNTAKHACASAAHVEVADRDGVLRVRVRDDGCGGADFSRGSGLTGLKDRVEAFGGRISLRSPPGAGTTLEITLPLDDPAGTSGLSLANTGS